ncbi:MULTISPECIES: CoA transferase [unclassified Chelatococcus]|uniref:CaiB/BaiF CoA transferase family protein n=1 Tax=unclassified Chelatococcus TaxID=2638111 RepID=UPI001BCE92E4|nr:MULTISPECIES: CoA transferase [unclassified Chelatococcus]CAH1655194.1 Carnitine dehydratase [Hyphomicrobiales bacterium]MBS7742645.1 CoA transferase [Chelatococcus sp. HY11]MBX3542237.1 CoA transferase [Chelatococcus sp.]MCO5075547.1 CoA transferase [Chelatococcus sp.]CAH1695366.1 Carnitine dehydratase [Hyphomicrobiales bacterium]
MSDVGTLNGLRVIDFTSMMAGPFATRMLVDCGAEVIKVESAAGDYMRYRSPLRDGRSAYYGQMNGGKKSIVLDLKSDKGRDVALRLIACADVVVENFRPGVMDSLGLGFGALKDSFPKLVYCSISGFGQSGVRARDPAYAPIIHAASGYDMAHLRYNDHLERPAVTGIFTADVIAAIYAFGAIQTALLHRERFGCGQHIDVTLIDSMLNMLVYEMQEAQFQSDQRRPLYQPLRTSDGFVMIAPVNQKNFENLAAAAGRPEWRDDPRFSTIRAREQNWSQLMGLIEEWTILRSAGECESIMMAAGVPCSRYATTAELIADPVMQERGSFEANHDGSGEFLIPHQPFRFSRAKTGGPRRVSDIGEDADTILSQVLGLDASMIQSLRNGKHVA